jgi:FtsH-binding integral membrane protein
MKTAALERAELVKQVENRLRRSGTPRLQMSLILLLTGGFGFLLSFTLLQIGVLNMAVRYPLAVLLAYCFFLLMLRLWLAYHNSRRTSDVDFDVSGLDFSPSVSGNGNSQSTFEFGGGGDFNGGGAGGSWEASSVVEPSISGSSSSDISASSSGGFDFDLDIGDAGAVIFFIIALIGLAFASLYVVYAAPVLLAEILVDSLLVAGLYKRLKGVDRRHWMRAAVRKLYCRSS